MTAAKFRAEMRELPLIAILRGLKPSEAPVISDVLVEAGFRLIEVPLNSPEPFASIRIMADKAVGRARIGAGTVLTADDVHRVADAGGRIIVSPNRDDAVIRATSINHGGKTNGYTVPNPNAQGALIREALVRCANNQTKAAEALGLSRFGLQKKLRRYNFA